MIGDILQPTHLLFVLVVALLVLGPKRLPEVGKALGRGLRDFKQAVSGEEIRDALNGTTSETPQSPIDFGQPSSPETEPAAAPATATAPAQPSESAVHASDEPEHESATEHHEPVKQNVA